jgi:hypothetical protein
MYCSHGLYTIPCIALMAYTPFHELLSWPIHHSMYNSHGLYTIPCIALMAYTPFHEFLSWPIRHSVYSSHGQPGIRHPVYDLLKRVR